MTQEPQKPILPLPRLSPSVRLTKGQSNMDGSPSWTLYHPVSNKYYKIGWIEFECLSRMPACKDLNTLIDCINTETTLNINADDIKDLLLFLQQNNLLEHAIAQNKTEIKDKALWEKILHQYLFFSIPLFKPQKFLEQTYPLVKPFMSKAFLSINFAILFVLIFMTMQRFDEFTHTFISFLSPEGIGTLFLTLFVIKIFHELGHAFAAHKYGAEVSHMGVAFMVLYPVLYTETSTAWLLKDRKSRVNIGLAGVLTEIIIATYALLLWHILPPGTLQSLAFAAVTISLIGSFVINLNPLMRFDGYFVLSDLLGIENLHAKSFAYARWWLRRILFGLQDQPPEDFKPATQRFLICFGLATLIYRFFLFLGIALLVYWLFFKPLGLILMIIELLWFIILPISNELKIWWNRRSEIWKHTRAKINICIISVFCIIYVLPIHYTITAPAIMHAQNYRVFYPPENSRITELLVEDQQRVKKGDLLAVLASSELEYNLEKALYDLKALQMKKRVLLASQNNIAQDLDTDIETAQQKITDLELKKEQLTFIAPFSGIIRFVDQKTHNGLWISKTTPLFSLIDPKTMSITAYIDENNLHRVESGYTALFRPHYAFLPQMSATLLDIQPTNIENLKWKELSSLYKGPIASEWDTETQREASAIKTRTSLYESSLTIKKTDINQIDNYEIVTAGTALIQGTPSTMLWDIFKKSAAFVFREINLN